MDVFHTPVLVLSNLWLYTITVCVLQPPGPGKMIITIMQHIMLIHISCDDLQYITFYFLFLLIIFISSFLNLT